MVAGVIQGSFLHKHPRGPAVRPVHPPPTATAGPVVERHWKKALRRLFKESYEYKRKQRYRRLNDADEKPDAGSYDRFVKPLKEHRQKAEKGFSERQGPGTENTWKTIWKDLDSLEEGVRRSIGGG